MKTLGELYAFAAREGIETHGVRCPHAGAIAAVVDGVSVIGLDRSLLKHENRERLALAHELGHTVTGAYYDRPDDPVNVRRMEWRAQKWTINQLVPREELDPLLTEDVTLWELADRFDVPEDMIKKAFWLYYKKELA